MQDDYDRLPAALTLLDVSNTFDPEVLGVGDVNEIKLFDTLFPLGQHCQKLTTFIARDLGTGQLYTCIFCYDSKDLYTSNA